MNLWWLMILKFRNNSHNWKEFKEKAILALSIVN
jgi:hypothetical protein